ncbi:MFS transporter [Actinomyces sp. B33]|uniref:MFS transporter n=1 Tax=Actinomyces sp. B33 TaxID=2942131 RepID=UPI002341CB20|nr:MFS transporter [Actinomyces sp. B33]MDC4233872.1 MFS transporter [Actinomyces sp. B33]
MRSSSAPTDPTLRALLAIALFTYTAQNMLNVSIAPLARALGLPEWIVGAAVSLAAVAVALLSQFWGRRSIAWGRRRVLLWALFLALVAGSLFSAAVWMRSAGLLGAGAAAGAIMMARGPFFGSAVAAIPPTGQALVAETTPDQESRVRGLSAFSGAISLSIMIGSLISSALGSWWIYAPVHATPWFIVVALVIAWIWIPRDSQGTATASPAPSPRAERDEGAAAASALLPPRVSWHDPRILPWIAGVFGMFFAAGVVQITMGFLVQDRLGLDPREAVSTTGLMLLASATGGMLMQLVAVPRLRWPPLLLLRVGMTTGLISLSALAVASSPVLIALAAFFAGVAQGLASPGFSAGASLSVTADEQGGVAGIVNATGAVTWIFAPVCATALYGWRPLSPFVLALVLLALSCASAWLHPRLASARR